MSRITVGALFFAGLLASLGGSGCTPAAGEHTQTPASKPSVEVRKCGMLSVNDTYRIEPSPDGSGGMAAVRALRKQLEALYPDLIVLHAGDFLFPSLLSRKYQGAQTVDVLNQLDGSPGFDSRLVVTFGNHEFDNDNASVLNARIAQSSFRWLSSNIDFVKSEGGKAGIATNKIAQDVIIPCGGFNVGIFAVTTDTKLSPLVVQFRDPVQTARERSKSLRERGADVVVGLTHLPIDIDEQILSTLGPEGPDVISGGHEHIKQSRKVGNRSVYKSDADARTAGVFSIEKRGSTTEINFYWQALNPTLVKPDADMQNVVRGWLEKHEREYCDEKLKASFGCLEEVLTVAKSPIIAEELEIRRYETNLGDFAADAMLRAFAKEGAQIAFINAGTLRLNYNIAADTPITRRVVEELFAYPAPLRLIEITGRQLEQVLQRATESWTGQGHWLQIGGFAFKFDPKAGKVSNLTLLGEKPRPISPTEKLKAVVTSFLIDPSKGQDGYTMLNPSQVIDSFGPNLTKGPDLKHLVVDAFKNAGKAGVILPLHGHVCNTERPGACLAL
ncbi:MAG: bifunctional metallophosphatase/5'-nucleotidase [Polyangiaceae bacterium]|nr:bifunctional metallophosphatase/5'-nucleotidase [Polyangiaceae bacterium]